MTRDAYSDRLLDLAYGELSKREAREVEEHATTCEACRAELARIRGTRRIMGALPDEPAPERGERILLAAAREAAEARRPRPLVPRWLLGGAVVAASLAVVAAVSLRVSEWSPRKDERTALLGESQYRKPAPEPGAEVARSAPAAAELADRDSGAEPPGLVGSRPEPPPSASAPPRVAAAPRRREASPPPASGPELRAYASPPPASGPELRAYASPPPAAPAQAPAGTAAPSGADARSRAAEAEGKAEDASRSFAMSARSADVAPQAAAPSAAPAQPAPPPSRGLSADAARRKSAAAPDARAGYGPTPAPPRAPSPAEERRFPGCEGEAERRVELDANGRVVRYVRVGRVDGRRLRIVHTFGPGGLLAGVTVTDLDAAGAALDPRAFGLSLPSRAEDAGIDAPPRCGR